MTGSLRAVVGGTLVDVHRGAAVPGSVVLVREGRVLAAGAQQEIGVPHDAEVLDATGRFVVPGYLDGNVHLMPFPSWGYPEFLARYEDRFADLVLEGAQIALRSGFTTVFDSMGPLDALVAVRTRIAERRDPGARLYVAGNILGFRAVFASDAARAATPAFRRRIDARFEAGGGPDLVYLSPEALYDRVREYVAQGVDFVKYGATGDGAPQTSEIGQSATLRFSERQQRAIVAACHDATVPVQTHTGSPESVHIAVEVGNDSGQHSFLTGPAPMYDETIELMLERGYTCGTQWPPPPSPGDAGEQPPPGWGSDGTWRVACDNIARLVAAGVPHFLSTDAGTIDPDVADEIGGGGLDAEAVPPTVGDAGFEAAETMQAHGLSPLEVLRGATLYPARAYRVEDRVGSLAEGRWADLLLLDADPLEDASNLRSIATVVQGGDVVDRTALPTRPVLTAPEARQPGAVRRV